MHYRGLLILTNYAFYGKLVEFMERLDNATFEKFKLADYIVSGNLYALDRWLAYEDVNVVEDSDGVGINSPKNVHQICENETGVELRPYKTDRWNYISYTLVNNGKSTSEANKYEGLWYSSSVLRKSEPYLFMRPLVRTLIKHLGRERQYVLTARRPDLKEATIESYKCHYPEIPSENILIRDNDLLDSEKFKKDEIAKLMPCIFIEDTFANLKPILNDPSFAKCLCIHIPLGVIKPEFHHERLIVVKRFPFKEQGMYPLFKLFERSFNNNNGKNFDVAQ